MVAAFSSTDLIVPSDITRRRVLRLWFLNYLQTSAASLVSQKVFVAVQNDSERIR
jgi:hypothetical protein